MAGISGQGVISAIDLYTSTATPGVGLQVGQYFFDGKNGKGFRYTLNGATAMVIGSIYQGAANDGTYENMAVGTAGVAGNNYLYVTNGTSTVTSAEYKGGTLSIYTAGTITVGDEYTIVGLSGTLTTGSTSMVVWLDRPLRAAVTTSAKVNMKRSPWSGVIATRTTVTEMVSGVAIYAVAASEYGWLQTHGPCSVVMDGAAVNIGGEIGVSATTSGYGSGFLATTATPCLPRIGYSRMTSIASTGHGLASFLQID